MLRGRSRFGCLRGKHQYQLDVTVNSSRCRSHQIVDSKNLGWRIRILNPTRRGVGDKTTDPSNKHFHEEQRHIAKVTLESQARPAGVNRW
jgi:hypothetical protein